MTDEGQDISLALQTEESVNEKVLYYDVRRLPCTLYLTSSDKRCMDCYYCIIDCFYKT
jgi:hypothetical protein